MECEGEKRERDKGYMHVQCFRVACCFRSPDPRISSAGDACVAIRWMSVDLVMMQGETCTRSTVIHRTGRRDGLTDGLSVRRVRSRGCECEERETRQWMRQRKRRQKQDQEERGVGLQSLLLLIQGQFPLFSHLPSYLTSSPFA